jgi:uncharacterized protein YdeI (YjbR/CyaY-like superfamily)
MKGGSPVRIRNRTKWRAWLEKNHSLKQDVWLLFYKKHTGKDWLQLAEAVEEALCFGWIDSTLRRIDDETHVIRFSPRRPQSVWSKINKDRVEKLIETGQMTHAGLEAVESAKQSGQWEAAYTSKEKPKVPKDLRHALKDNAEAWRFFETLSNSNQLMYVHWVTSAKRETTRNRRIEKVVEQCARGEKPG